MAYVRRVEALGFGVFWAPETVGREPFALMAMLATATDSLILGTSIASIYARDAVTTRTAALTIAEASGGRFILGLGVSHPHLVTKVRGHDYGKPVTTMREYLAAYHAAPWRGPTVADGVLPGPPIVLAALRENMTALAATETDGPFPYLVTAERLAWIRGVADRAAAGGAAAVGADRGARPLLAVTVPVVLEPSAAAARAAARAYLVPYFRGPNYRASFGAQGFVADDWEGSGSDRLVDAMVAWGPVPAITRRIDAMFAAGADHVALIPLSPDGKTEDLATIEALAERLLG